MSTALVCIDTARAQTAAQDDPPTRAEATPARGADESEIVVTAQRRSQSIADVPMSITAVSGEQLSTLGVTDVAELVKITPGLSAVESGAAVPVYSLRGVGFFDTSIGARPTVSIYLDEVPLPFSIMTSGTSFDLQRVEVLKGPQGTLFGQNSTGGAINYIANRPTDVFEAGVTLDYSRFDRIQTEGYLSGPLGDALRLRLAVRGDNGGAWQESYTRDDSHGERRFWQGRFTADWDVTERLDLSFTLSGFRDESDVQASQLTQVLLQRPAAAAAVPLLIAYPLAPHEARAADWNDQDFPLRRDNSFYQGAIRANWALSDSVSLVSLTSYADMDVHQRVDLDATSLAAIFTENTGSATSFAQEVRLIGDHARTNWVIGASYAEDDTHQIDDYQIPYGTGSSLPTGPFNHFFLDSEQAFRTAAVFGNFEHDLTDTLTGSVGVRYTQADLDYAACSRVGNAVTGATLTSFFNILRGPGNPLPAPLAVGDCLTIDATTTPGQVTGELNEDSLSWRVNLSWSPAPRTLVYANVSQGYKSGSGPVLPALAANQLSPVVQESVLAYELGVRAPLAGNWLDASGAIFFYSYEDKQLKSRTLVEPAVLGALEATVNVPESEILGAELQLNARPIPGLTLSITGTYIASEVISDFQGYTITGALANFQGESFPYTPEYQIVADARYSWGLSDNLDAFVSTNINYRSETTAGFGRIPILDIDEYTLVDLQGGVSAVDGSWQVVGYVRNVTDEYYWTNMARINDTVRRFTGMPRTYGIRVSRSF
ncbi:MAG: TonB-dependent receptor [Hyphomonadaceae bacterium]